MIRFVVVPILYAIASYSAYLLAIALCYVLFVAIPLALSDQARKPNSQQVPDYMPSTSGSCERYHEPES